MTQNHKRNNRKRPAGRSGGRHAKASEMSANNGQKTEGVDVAPSQLPNNINDDVGKMAEMYTDPLVKAAVSAPPAPPCPPEPSASGESLQADKADGEAGTVALSAMVGTGDVASSAMDTSTGEKIEPEAPSATPPTSPRARASSPRPDMPRAASSSLNASSSCSASPSAGELSGSGASDVAKWTGEKEGDNVDSSLIQCQAEAQDAAPPTPTPTPTTQHGHNEQALHTDVGYPQTEQQHDCLGQQLEQHMITSHEDSAIIHYHVPVPLPAEDTTHVNHHQQFEHVPVYVQNQCVQHFDLQEQCAPHLLYDNHGHGTGGYAQVPYQHQPQWGFWEGHAYGQYHDHQYGYDISATYTQGHPGAYMPPQGPVCYDSPAWQPTGPYFPQCQGPSSYHGVGPHPDCVFYDENGCVIERQEVMYGQHDRDYSYTHPATYGPAPPSMMPQHNGPMIEQIEHQYPNGWQPMPTQLPGVPHFTPDGFPGDLEQYCNYMHTTEGIFYKGDMYNGQCQMQQPSGPIKRRHRRRHNRKGGRGRTNVAAF